MNVQEFLNTTEKVFIHDIEIAPSDPDIIYALASVKNTDQGVLLISTDGGDHWRVSNTEVDGHGSSLAVDPLDANRLYVGTKYSGVWRSEDGGKSFQSINEGLPYIYYRFMSVTVDPNNPERIYLGVGGSVYFSSDRGSNWSKLAGDLSIGNEVNVITVDPQNPENVYACAESDGAFQLLGWDPNNP